MVPFIGLLSSTLIVVLWNSRMFEFSVKFLGSKIKTSETYLQIIVMIFHFILTFTGLFAVRVFVENVYRQIKA